MGVWIVPRQIEAEGAGQRAMWFMVAAMRIIFGTSCYGIAPADI